MGKPSDTSLKPGRESHSSPRHAAAEGRSADRWSGWRQVRRVRLVWRLAQRWQRRHHLLFKRLGAGGLALLLALVLALVWAWQATPSTAGLQDWVRAQDARHGVPYTPFANISPWVGRALVAIEDERFYQHHGIDTIGLLRAVWDDLRAGSVIEGGSTLTAQLAKNAYLHNYDRTLPLKLEDLLLATKIESRYTKASILEMYLNLVYFGQGAYGIGAASARYFGVAPARLDAAQAALLAGMVRAPGLYNPWCHPDLARARQHAVLDQMMAEGYLTPAQEQRARRETFPFWRPGATLPADAYCAR